MKRIVSVSIGSASRDKSVETEILGEKYLIERVGTDGSIKKAVDIIKNLDGKVDAFGMGGIDLKLTAATGKEHLLKAAIPIKKAAKKTPIVDGSGLKNTLEQKAVYYLKDNNILELKDKKVLLTCAVDRYKMAEAFFNCGCEVVLGDLIFSLGIPIPIKNLKTLRKISRVAIPIVSNLPFKMIYPIGNEQNKINFRRFSKYYFDADIIAGDYHYIKKYMPFDLTGKIIVTNTVTMEDVELLKSRGVKMLITTTPNLDGRSFGTNVIEALLMSVCGKKADEMEEKEYYEMIDKLQLKPRVEYLN